MEHVIEMVENVNGDRAHILEIIFSFFFHFFFIIIVSISRFFSFSQRVPASSSEAPTLMLSDQRNQKGKVCIPFFPVVVYMTKVEYSIEICPSHLFVEKLERKMRRKKEQRNGNGKETLSFYLHLIMCQFQ